MPPVTFSPEKLAELLNMLSDQKAELAAIKASMVEANKAKMAKPAPVAVAGTASGEASGRSQKTDKALANQLATIKAFKAKGFGVVQPHIDVLTFNKWVALGFRPVEGSKSLKINNLRLFQKSQVRPITAAEKKANAKQQAAAVARHEGKATASGKPGNVTQLNPQ